MRTWRLADADVIATEHKYTFYKPSRNLIERLSPGEHVKLIFEFDSDDPKAPRAERMWVIVDEVRGHGRFRGRLDNQPAYIEDLEPGDPIDFEDCHIIATSRDDEDTHNLVERYLLRCFVTKGVLADGGKVVYLYREDPDEERDSGWRLFSDADFDEPIAPKDNVAYVSLGAVLNHDDSFIHLLDEPVGSAFERDPATGEFAPVRGKR